MNPLLKATGLFTENKSSTPHKPEVHANPITIKIEPMVHIVPSATITVSQESVNKFIQHFEEILSQANLPGPDYYEFSKTLDTLAPHIPDQKTRITVAFQTLGVQGLTLDKLVSSAQAYIEVLKKDKLGFENALKNKQQSEVVARQDKIAKLTTLMESNKEQIKVLEKQIADSAVQIQQLNKDIAEADANIQKNEGAYVTACDAYIQKISTDVETVKATIA
jgi:hypothetical protein